MPNHIKNQIELTGSTADIDDMLKRFSSDHDAHVATAYDGAIILIGKADKHQVRWMDPQTGAYRDRDGVKGIGIPEGFEIEVHNSFLIFPDFTKVIPPPNDDAYHDRPSQDVARHSPNWWYDWNYKHWGTKWSGYSYRRLGVVKFSFDTAWAAPHPVIQALSKQCPKVKIEHTWADEDTGYNCGRVIYEGGSLIDVYQPNAGSKEAYEIAFEVRPELKSEYELVGNSYEYKDGENAAGLN